MTLERRKPDPRDGLGDEQRAVLRLLGLGHSSSDAARLAHVSEERVKRWMAQATFKDALARERVDPSPRTSGLAMVLLEAGEESDALAVPTSKAGRRSRAIDLLAAGVTLTEAAELSGYSRQHLSHLVNHESDFQAEYGRRLAEAHHRRANRSWTIYDKAAGVVERALEEGDPRVALEIFKLHARGVTDVTYVESSATEEVGNAPVRSGSDSPDGRSPELECETCGRRMKSASGLTRHRRAKHAD
jgi:hypothetical protein